MRGRGHDWCGGGAQNTFHLFMLHLWSDAVGSGSGAAGSYCKNYLVVIDSVQINPDDPEGGSRTAGTPVQRFMKDNVWFGSGTLEKKPQSLDADGGQRSDHEDVENQVNRLERRDRQPRGSEPIVIGWEEKAVQWWEWRTNQVDLHWNVTRSSKQTADINDPPPPQLFLSFYLIDILDISGLSFYIKLSLSYF